MYVCTWYQPADERSARGRTSDDSYMYQLSLVVATATAVSFDFINILQSLYLSRMNIVSADAGLSGSR